MGSNNPIDIINKELDSQQCRRLLEKVDKMREILRLEKFSLPQIVVVGEQSVGKSSILEAISGVELPRAQGICTRCPLELRLKRTPHGQKDHATIACEGVEKVVLNDLSQIADAVIQCTNRLTGDLVSVSSSPILLTVYKEDIRDDLTLVDLPGIVRAQERGHPSTTYQDITNLIHQCTQPKTAIVVHVIPSCTDFTTSETIGICQQYDPRFERQIIVASKIDKHDQGIGEKLQGHGSGSIAFSLGCVAVLNRKQEEIDSNISFDEMRRREREFFRTNPAFHGVPKEHLGSHELVRKLVSIQQNNIRSILPSVIDDVKAKLQMIRQELKQFPTAILTENDARITFIEILRNYRAAVEKCAKGDYAIDTEKPSEEFNPEDRNKWNDRIAFHLKMFVQVTARELEGILSKFSTTNQSAQVAKLIDENYGGGLPNFPTSNIIQQLYQPCHKKLETPCKKLVIWVESYMVACLEYILGTVVSADIIYRNALIDEIRKVIKDLIEKSKEKCLENVEQMLAMEERVFTVNPQYMMTFTKLKEKESNDTLSGLRSYCTIVHARIVDHLSQLCDYWFVQNGVLILDKKLNAVFTPNELLKIMKDLPIIEQKRANLQRSVDAMERALAAAEVE